jgi:hypothetical protein
VIEAAKIALEPNDLQRPHGARGNIRKMSLVNLELARRPNLVTVAA